nr:unnamed protein product [Callosobruchus analis]
MNPKPFYGSMSAVRLPDIESEDLDLSDEDDNNPPIILAPDSDYEELDEVQNRDEQTVISETGSSDDNIPLSIQFTGSQDLPSTILELDSPHQFFKFLFPDSLIEYITEQSNFIRCNNVQIDQPT